MMKNSALLKNLFCVILFSVNTFVFAKDVETKSETNDLKYILSFDTDISMTALKNYGWGLGVNYERKLTEFLSIKPGFGHMTCFSDITVTTVNLKLLSHYYPLSNGLDKLYTGAGVGCDFVMYNNNTAIPQDDNVSLLAIIGWKWKILPHLMIDPSIGWKLYVHQTDNHKDVGKYLNDGFQWGVGLKLFFQNRKK